MNQRLLTSVFAVLLLSGCAATPPAPVVRILTAPADPVLDATTSPLRLNGDDTGTAKTDLPPDVNSLDDILDGGPPHASRKGLDNVRVWPGRIGDANSAVGSHPTAKYFFQQIIVAAQNASTSATPPQKAHEKTFPIDAGQYNAVACLVRFDDPGDGSVTDKDYPRMIWVGYFESRLHNMAWIEYALEQKKLGVLIRHRHRILFVERNSFNDVDYYGFPTAPSPTKQRTPEDGLACSGKIPATSAGNVQPRDDGGGGGEM